MLYLRFDFSKAYAYKAYSAFKTGFHLRNHRIAKGRARHRADAHAEADGSGAAGFRTSYYSAVVVGGHRAVDSEVVAGNRLVVVLAARRYPAFACR